MWSERGKDGEVRVWKKGRKVCVIRSGWVRVGDVRKYVSVYRYVSI